MRLLGDAREEIGHGASPSPRDVQAEVREDLTAKLGKVRIAAMARIRLRVDDLRPDLRGPVAHHDYAPGEQKRFLDVMRDQQRREARLPP
jgi:hypothetical protein